MFLLEVPACRRGVGSGLVLLKDLPLLPVSQAAPSVSTGAVWEHRSTDCEENGKWVDVLSQAFRCGLRGGWLSETAACCQAWEPQLSQAQTAGPSEGDTLGWSWDEPAGDCVLQTSPVQRAGLGGAQRSLRG